jgi:hypothetical protein
MAYDSERSAQRLQPGSEGESLARGLGIFSIVLGAAEVLAPRTLARTLGMTGSESLICAYGLREIATGVGIGDHSVSVGGALLSALTSRHCAPIRSAVSR